MALVTVSNLKKSYVERVILDGVGFKIEKNDKIGIIGVNGAGKTTLFRLLCGIEEFDSGSIVKEKGVKIAYMQQMSDYDSPLSATETLEKIFAECINLERKIAEAEKEAESEPSEINIKRLTSLNDAYIEAGGLVFRSRIRAALFGLGFDDMESAVPMSGLSGGQKTRVMLASVLLSDADILFLDEPTNHLDISSTLWLEDYLSSYKCAVVTVSHDRYFLDKITNRIFEIENTHLTEYNGNYSDYRAQRAINDLSLEREYEKKEKEIKRIEGIIAQQIKFGQERNYITIKSKQKQIDRIKADLIKPEKAPSAIDFSFKTNKKSGNDVLFAENVSKSFGQKELFRGLSGEIKAGERIFIAGPNGCGKTTFLRMLIGEDSDYSGKIKWGVGVDIGYYDQNLNDIDPDKTIFDELVDKFPRKTNFEIRKALALFLFKNDDVFKKCSMLSGGEKARVCLAKLMLAAHNTLILDEPTNHLDINSKEALEDALSDYDGTLIIVSHDRYFINRLATSLWYIKDRGMSCYKGNFDEYLLNRDRIAVQVKEDKADKTEAYMKRKADDAELRKKKKRLETVEKLIEETESENGRLAEELNNGGADYQKLMEINAKIEENEKKINDYYEEMEMLTEFLDG